MNRTNNDSPKQFGLFNVIRGVDADTAEIKSTEIIIETIMPKGVCGIIAGTTGANKSFLAMQMGMSIANDEDSFLEFEIKEKGLSVLFADTEIGERLMTERYDLLKKNFTWTGSSRFNMISKQGSFKDIWNDLVSAITHFKPDVVIIDCLYNASVEKEFSKGHKISGVIEHLTEIKTRHNVTLYCVHHMNKGGHELGLQKDRMSGASALQNWVEHLILMTDTNDTNMRLIKIDKSRVVDYPKCYYGIEWDSEKLFLSNIGLVENWQKYLHTEEMILKWKEALERMNDHFSTKDWLDVVVNEMAKSERTAHSWLYDMNRSGIIKDLGYGSWIKVLEIIDSE